ncbi:anti-sigma-f factor fin [Lucifera butyrica]|uniref:Anti-sigma-f factor fin n=1 Tax=Lucifera butyrica TaxID=1351585 RepID=A0A498R4L0_9FIRM|nr:anti-sigma-F factor Fin [Lucifera butyrica]VBB06374.1 anti-sigma-f factor fin [Lucifera butyrica]
MKIYYICEFCGDPIDTLEIDQIDEARFGFDCLTGEERQDIIKIDSLTNSIQVQSLCDQCIEALGLAEEEPVIFQTGYLH